MKLRCKLWGHKRKAGSTWLNNGLLISEAWCRRCGENLTTETPTRLMNRQSPPDTIEGFRGK